MHRCWRFAIAWWAGASGSEPGSWSGMHEAPQSLKKKSIAVPQNSVAAPRRGFVEELESPIWFFVDGLVGRHWHNWVKSTRRSLWTSLPAFCAAQQKDDEEQAGGSEAVAQAWRSLRHEVPQGRHIFWKLCSILRNAFAVSRKVNHLKIMGNFCQLTGWGPWLHIM